MAPGFKRTQMTARQQTGRETSTARVLGAFWQPKLRLNEPGDEYEQEAERVAERAMQTPSSTFKTNDPLGAKPALVQRRVTEAAGGGASSLFGPVLSSSGQPLDRATRSFFEARLGHDFSGVRIHADAKAADSARAMHAVAYTTGQDVVFGAGHYAPGTTAGQKLLAHELAHVVQQTGVQPTGAGITQAQGQIAGASASSRNPQATPGHTAGLGLIQRQPEPEPPEFPDFPGLLQALELNVGKNLFDYGHHLYRASVLHPDEPQYLENALTRYALGLNVLKTSYRFAGFEQGTADKLALGTGILFKGLTFVTEGEFTLDYQIDIGKGLKLETNIDLAVNPDNPTHLRKAEVNLGVVGHF